MGVSNRRLEHYKAKEFGDALDVFVKKRTGNWHNPVVATATVADEFEMTEAAVIDHLMESELVRGKEVAPDVWVWW